MNAFSEKNTPRETFITQVSETKSPVALASYSPESLAFTNKLPKQTHQNLSAKKLNLYLEKLCEIDQIPTRPKTARKPKKPKKPKKPEEPEALPTKKPQESKKSQLINFIIDKRENQLSRAKQNYLSEKLKSMVLNSPEKLYTTIRHRVKDLKEASQMSQERITPKDPDQKDLLTTFKQKLSETNLNPEKTVKAFLLLVSWDKSRGLYEEVQSYTAGMKIKSEDSCASFKAARQRSEAEIRKKLLDRAEAKRKSLRVKQEQFQRVLTTVKIKLNSLYGRNSRTYSKRQLLTTASEKGSPLFITSMIKLGYLPSYLASEAKSTRSIPCFKKSFVAKINNAKLIVRQNEAASRIKAFVRGVVQRLKYSKMKLSSNKIKKAWKSYLAKKILITKVVESLVSGNPKELKSLPNSLRRYRLFSKIYSQKHKNTSKKAPQKSLTSSSEQTQLTSRNSDIEVPPEPSTRHSPVRSKTPKSTYTLKAVKQVNFKRSPSDTSDESYKLQKLEVDAVRINNLLLEISKMRQEMWKFYLSNITLSEFEGQSTLKLLSNASIYAKDNKRSGGTWIETGVDLGTSEDKWSMVTAESLKNKPTEKFIEKLSQELSKAISCRDAERQKFYSRQTKLKRYNNLVKPPPKADNFIKRSNSFKAPKKKDPLSEVISKALLKVKDIPIKKTEDFLDSIQGKFTSPKLKVSKDV